MPENAGRRIRSVAALCYPLPADYAGATDTNRDIPHREASRGRRQNHSQHAPRRKRRDEAYAAPPVAHQYTNASAGMGIRSAFVMKKSPQLRDFARRGDGSRMLPASTAQDGQQTKRSVPSINFTHAATQSFTKLLAQSPHAQNLRQQTS